MLPVLAGIAGLVTFVCFILVVVQMFQHGKTGPGLASVIGFFVCGLGGLFAFIYGWMKAGEWRIQNIMIAWTVSLVLYIALAGASFPAIMEQMRQEAQRQQNANNPAVPGPGPVPVPAPAPAPAPVPATP